MQRAFSISCARCWSPHPPSAKAGSSTRIRRRRWRRRSRKGIFDDAGPQSLTPSAAQSAGRADRNFGMNELSTSPLASSRFIEFDGGDIESYLEAQENKDLLRFITCGSVDDGKSTLIGRLLYEA